MKITMNTVVTIDFELKDSDGNTLEKSKEPITYLHGGFDNIFPKVEEGMHGKDIGETVEISLDPKDAFGEYDESLVNVESIEKFPEKNIKEGMQFEGENEQGEIIVYTVTNIADNKVVVDGNHPWAGQRLLFIAKILEVRAANAEEIQHKHVHGPGGHHHH
ncbi:MAG: peptidylprolyl isomerase [Nitrosomonadales bacterium]|jgi:FKBP-type peptidyl-prolyl cis-trans isomerase SlyD